MWRPRSSSAILWTAFLEVLCRHTCFLLSSMEVSIKRTWDGNPINHDPVKITMYPERNNTAMVIIEAPYFGDEAPPGGEKGKPFDKLWDYEVVEMFFLGAEEKYLEMEFSPHGQHLILFLSGRRNIIKKGLPIRYTSSISGSKWIGYAHVPFSYFPASVLSFNAYAIHGTGERRQYEALFPVDEGAYPHPDFHRLETFGHFTIVE